MAPPKPNQNPSRKGEFLSAQTAKEPRAWMPWIIASVVVGLVLVGLIVLGRRPGSEPAPGGVGMAPAAPYAANLPIDGLQMSEASSFSGAKVTYIDGHISNTGNETITAITVQVGYRNDLNELAQRTVMPLTFIRTREPYVDTEPVSAAPLKPGGRQDFRLIFDSVPPDWNQQLPEIRVISSRSQ